MWAAAIACSPAPRPRSPASRWSPSASAPAPSRSACCACSGCSGAPRPSATGRLARFFLRVEAVPAHAWPSRSTFVDAIQVSDLDQPGWLALDVFWPFSMLGMFAHRHPDRDRRPLERPVPLLADGRRELGGRRASRPSAIFGTTPRPWSSRRCTCWSATPCSACWSPARSSDSTLPRDEPVGTPGPGGFRRSRAAVVRGRTGRRRPRARSRPGPCPGARSRPSPPAAAPRW